MEKIGEGREGALWVNGTDSQNSQDQATDHARPREIPSFRAAPGVWRPHLRSECTKHRSVFLELGEHVTLVVLEMPERDLRQY